MTMSAMLGDLSFEKRLQLAFRGDAGEQKKAQREAQEERRRSFRLGRTPPGQAFLSRKAQGLGSGSNVFKKNLGGTA